MIHRKRRETGLTLVEMLIAVALLGFVLLGIAPLFIMSVKSNYAANEFTSIHNLARDRLEQLMSLPISDPQLSAAGYPTPFPNDLPTTMPDPTTGAPPSQAPNPLQRTYTVQNFALPIVDITLPGAVPNGGVFVGTPVTPPGTYHFKRIDVTVTATNGGIGQRMARVTGYVRNPDPGNIIN